MGEKDRTAQVLHDEISTLQLELTQIEERNATLKKDNAKLLERWLDAKQGEVNSMNEANESRLGQSQSGASSCLC